MSDSILEHPEPAASVASSDARTDEASTGGDPEENKSRGMYLSRLSIENFRSCYQTSIRLDADLTVIVGENNSGKSNVIDALRLALAPLGQRRTRYFDTTDFSHGREDQAIILRAEFAGLTPIQRGHYVTALRMDDMTAIYTTRFHIDESRLRSSRPVVLAGPGDGPDSEPAKHDQLCHIYLEPLRDAQRELDSSGSRRLATIIEYLIDPAEVQRFVDDANQGLQHLESDPVITHTGMMVQEHLSPLTDPVRAQQVGVRFTEYELRRLASGMRLKMAEAGVDLAHLADSGLGYANLLYIATVLLELQNASDAELTVLLVEEPEAHLHPQLQATLLAYLQEQAELSGGDDSTRPAGRIQVVVTTHSPVIASSVPIENVVVLRSVAIDPAVVDPEVGGDEVDASADPDSALASTSKLSTRSIAVSDLGLTDREARKVGQYLDATKASLFFGRRIVLVEGVSEAVLLPVLGRNLYAGEDQANITKRRALAGVTIVNIGSVDFEPYVRLLLNEQDGISILDRLVVITDTDPSSTTEEKQEEVDTELPQTPTRLARLQQLAEEYANRLVVCPADYTLEADLLVPDMNEPVLRKAFLAQKPRSARTWQGFIDSGDRVAAFYERLHGNRGFISKGQFAHDIAVDVAAGTAIHCPQYLAAAIDAALEPLP